MHVLIDIHSNKFLECLIDRRYCSRNYYSTLMSEPQKELTYTFQIVPPGFYDKYKLKKHKKGPKIKRHQNKGVKHSIKINFNP